MATDPSTSSSGTCRLSAIILESINKAIMIVAHARTPVAVPPPSSSSSSSPSYRSERSPSCNRWFHTNLDEASIATPVIQAIITSLRNKVQYNNNLSSSSSSSSSSSNFNGFISVNLQVVLLPDDDSAEQEDVLLEEWRLHVTPRSSNATSADNNNYNTAPVLETPTVYKRLVVVMRSLYTLVHALPAAAIAKHLPARIQIKTAQTPTADIDENAEFNHFHFAAIKSAVATVKFQAVYRTENALEHILRQVGNNGDVRADWVAPATTATTPTPLPPPTKMKTPMSSPVPVPQRAANAVPLNTQSGFHLQAASVAVTTATTTGNAAGPVGARAASAPNAHNNMPRVPSGVLSDLLARKALTAGEENAVAVAAAAASPPPAKPATEQSPSASPSTTTAATPTPAPRPTSAASLPFAMTPPSFPSTPGLHGVGSVVGVPGGSLVRRSSWSPRETPSSGGSGSVFGATLAEGPSASVTLNSPNPFPSGLSASGLGDAVAAAARLESDVVAAAAAWDDDDALPFALDEEARAPPSASRIASGGNDGNGGGAATTTPSRAWSWGWGGGARAAGRSEEDGRGGHQQDQDQQRDRRSDSDADAAPADADLGGLLQLLKSAPSLRSGSTTEERSLADALDELNILKGF